MRAISGTPANYDGDVGGNTAWIDNDGVLPIDNVDIEARITIDYGLLNFSGSMAKSGFVDGVLVSDEFFLGLVLNEFPIKNGSLFIRRDPFSIAPENYNLTFFMFLMAENADCLYFKTVDHIF